MSKNLIQSKCPQDFLMHVGQVLRKLLQLMTLYYKNMREIHEIHIDERCNNLKIDILIRMGCVHCVLLLKNSFSLCLFVVAGTFIVDGQTEKVLDLESGSGSELSGKQESKLKSKIRDLFVILGKCRWIKNTKK